MIYCTTSLKLHDGFSVETYNLNALDAVVNQRECAIFPGFRNANVGWHKPEDTAQYISNKYFWSEDKSAKYSSLTSIASAGIG